MTEVAGPPPSFARPSAVSEVDPTATERPRASGRGSPTELAPVDVLVATYESGATLSACLASARQHLPVARIIVVDRASQDSTRADARAAGAEVYNDTVGLGRARNLALRQATTDPVLFLDSDVVISRPDFYPLALEEYRRPRTGAVVGMSEGHRFRYGLPLGLTLIGRAWALSAGIPDGVQGRETYFLQRAVRRDHLQVRYVPEAMRHFGTYRRAPRWPEFQGASMRRAAGASARELLYAAGVVTLMHLNSGRIRNVLYSPIFYGRLIRGFVDPARWERLSRTGAAPTKPS